jgi:hypothetical protein
LLCRHGTVEEYHARRENAAIMWIHRRLRKFYNSAPPLPDAEALCQYAFTRKRETTSAALFINRDVLRARRN